MLGFEHLLNFVKFLFDAQLKYFFAQSGKGILKGEAERESITFPCSKEIATPYLVPFTEGDAQCAHWVGGVYSLR